VETVWSSDLRRAVETARLVAGEPAIDARLRELDFGDLEGLKWDECARSQRDALRRFEGFIAPGGESVEQLRKRVHAFLTEIQMGIHLLVTHGGVIRLLMRERGDARTVSPAGLVELRGGS
jgi:probable phosphoglycerate mutase